MHRAAPGGRLVEPLLAPLAGDLLGLLTRLRGRPVPPSARSCPRGCPVLAGGLRLVWATWALPGIPPTRPSSTASASSRMWRSGGSRAADVVGEAVEGRPRRQADQLRLLHPARARTRSTISRSGTARWSWTFVVDLRPPALGEVEAERPHARRPPPGLPQVRGDPPRQLDVAGGEVDVEGHQRPAGGCEDGSGGRVDRVRPVVGGQLAGLDALRQPGPAASAQPRARRARAGREVPVEEHGHARRPRRPARRRSAPRPPPHRGARGRAKRPASRRAPPRAGGRRRWSAGRCARPPPSRGRPAPPPARPDARRA